MSGTGTGAKWWTDGSLVEQVVAPAAALVGKGALGEEARYYLAGLSVKLEPIVRARGDGAGGVWGFEFLALGPGGDGFGPLTARAKELGVELEMRLMVMALAMEGTGLVDRFWQRRRGRSQGILYTMNIDNVMLAAADAAAEVLSRVLDAHVRSRLLFEANEELTEAEGKRLKGFLAAVRCGYGLDDGNDMEHGVRTLLRPDAAFAKADFKTTRDILAHLGTVPPDQVMKELVRFKLDERPFVIEGVEKLLHMMFVEEWADESDVPVLIQGHAVRLGEEWLDALVPLSELGPWFGYAFRPGLRP